MVACHLTEVGARHVSVLERGQIGNGSSSQSSGILCTYYAVKENVAPASKSWQTVTNFAAYVGDEIACAGRVQCGYVIAAPQGPKLDPLPNALAAQTAMGIALNLLTPAQASERLPIYRSNDTALIGFEPEV